jgi:drug/metabolite transporter (DMT)-like permease
MTGTELFLCLIAVSSSSAAQLCLKAASSRLYSRNGIFLATLSGGLMLISILVAVWVLRTIHLSQLVPIAALAYVFVPLGGRLLFREALRPRFGAGVFIIMSGIYLTTL